ncbi:hypothetical protein PMIN03_005882 [Paraphaeosphaeria minitans]
MRTRMCPSMHIRPCFRGPSALNTFASTAGGGFGNGIFLGRGMTHVDNRMISAGCCSEKVGCAVVCAEPQKNITTAQLKYLLMNLHRLRRQARASKSLKSFYRIRCQTKKPPPSITFSASDAVSTAARLSGQENSVGPHTGSRKARGWQKKKRSLHPSTVVVPIINIVNLLESWGVLAVR